jgi:NDP-sugar pyrophosphorylase family protein
MQVVILAGGLATRLQPLTEKKPKSLIDIHGKPFLEYQLDFLRKAEVKNVVLCVGYLGTMIEEHFGNGRKFGIDIKYNYETNRLLGTGGALKRAEGLLEDEFFTLYGDSYIFLDFRLVMSYFKKNYKLGLMVVYRNYNRYDSSNVIVENNRIKYYGKEESEFEMTYIDYGASVFRKKALELIPPNQVYSLGEFFNQLIEREELLAYEVDKRFYQIGSPEGLEEFTKYVAGLRAVR